MLSWSFVVQRIKDELSLPFQVLEKSDEEIIDYLKRTCVKKFSTYFPSKARYTLDTSKPEVKVPNRQSEFYLIEPDDREILNVVQCHFNLGNYVITGHNPIGAFSYGEVPAVALQNFQANNLRGFSLYEYTYEFTSPNILRISPKFTGSCTIEYERVIDTELSDITTELEDYFIDLCIAMTFMLIGRIRKKYQNIQTPFGEIQLDAEALFSEGQERYNKVMEDLQNKCLPNVIFDRG